MNISGDAIYTLTNCSNRGNTYRKLEKDKKEFTTATQNMCGDASQLLSEERHVRLSNINTLQHRDWRLSLWELRQQ